MITNHQTLALKRDESVQVELKEGGSGQINLPMTPASVGMDCMCMHALRILRHITTRYLRVGLAEPACSKNWIRQGFQKRF